MGVSLSLAGALGLAFLISFLITPLVIKLAPRIGALDRPNYRKVHTRIMPRMGGLAIYLGFIITILATQTISLRLGGLLAGGSMIIILGIADDILGLSPRGKLLGQVAAALILVAFGTQANFITNPFSGGVVSLGYMSIPLTVLWIIGVTNAVNLIDGLDGLAAGVSAVAAITLAVVGWGSGQMDTAVWALILAMSTLGFLPYNFHPARIFMGDSGSMFLGYNLAALSLLSLTKSTTAFSLVIPFIILGIPILDTACAIVRRLVGGQPIFKADRDHLHHRLLGLGLSHRGTVLVIYLFSGIFGLSALGLTYFTRPGAMLVLFVLFGATMYGAGRLGVLAPQRNSGQHSQRYRGISH